MAVHQRTRITLGEHRLECTSTPDDDQAAILKAFKTEQLTALKV